MIRFFNLARHLAIAATGLTVLLTPAVASAQDYPSYATPASTSTDETIHGRIRSVDGAFNISVDDDRGFVDNIELHAGTIINPTGLTLAPGMSVTILGSNAGSMLEANEIDTPYSYDGPLPTPVYLGPGYWCPGFAYGYGPSFGLAIVFGGGGGGWHYDHRPFYGRPWDGHAYFGAAVGYAGPSGRGVDEALRGSGIHTEPSARRLPSSDPHAPAAFQGRSFAGESRRPADGGNATGYVQETAPHVFNSTQTGREPVTRPAYSGGGFTRGGGEARSFGGGEARSSGGGEARSSGGGGAGRAAGGGGHGGGGHRH